MLPIRRRGHRRKLRSRLPLRRRTSRPTIPSSFRRRLRWSIAAYRNVRGVPITLDCPVFNVNYFDAYAYAKWKGRRLPTEQEWEKAARGTDARTYPWGNDWDSSKLQCSKTKLGDAMSTAAVGGYPSGASPYGVLDMAGNVWQWCRDWYDENYYQTSPKSNPIRSGTGMYCVLRGGSWYYITYNFRCAYRNRYLPLSRLNYIGFRCVVLARP